MRTSSFLAAAALVAGLGAGIGMTIPAGAT